MKSSTAKKTIIDKLWGTYEEKCAQLRTLYFYMFTHPGKKLNFMGNELGHFREWDEKKELDWGLMKYPFHDSFQKYFAELGRLYATEPALYDGEYNPGCFEWVASESRDEGVYAWLRKGAGQTILCVMNTQNTAHKKFPLYLKFPCAADELLNSEAPPLERRGQEPDQELPHHGRRRVWPGLHPCPRPARHGQPDAPPDAGGSPRRRGTGFRPESRCRQAESRRKRFQEVIFA